LVKPIREFPPHRPNCIERPANEFSLRRRHHGCDSIEASGLGRHSTTVYPSSSQTGTSNEAENVGDDVRLFIRR
jgi:hypothetical protein